MIIHVCSEQTDAITTIVVIIIHVGQLNVLVPLF